jgi:AraC-like DNA-binding protein
VLISGTGSLIRLADMARECGLSVSHFERAFRKSFGKSPYRWLLERRIDRSKALLATTELPIAHADGGALQLREPDGG